MHSSPTYHPSKPATTPSLSAQDIRTLEQTRQRLYQLTESLSSLNRDVHSQHPLPSWTSLTSRLTLLSTHLASLQTHLSTSHPLLSSLTITPAAAFPTEQEPLLGLLLRKRLEPGVEGWVADGLAQGRSALSGSEDRGDGMGAVREGTTGGKQMMMGQEEEWKELWRWAPPAANGVAMEGEWLLGEWTPEEKARGLHLEAGGEGEGDEEMEDEEEEEEEEEEGVEGAGGGMKMEEVLRFLSTGVRR
ncbi:MAG: hypothetical protein Q9202_003833 [Teloschistes flavicans]